MQMLLALWQQADARLRFGGAAAAALNGYTPAHAAPLPMPTSVGFAVGAAGAPLNGLHNPSPTSPYVAAPHGHPPPVYAEAGGNLGGHARTAGFAGPAGFPGPAGLGDPGALQPRGSTSSSAGAALAATAFPGAVHMQPPALPPDWPAGHMVHQASKSADIVPL